MKLFAACTGALLIACTPLLHAAPDVIEPQIMVDQFGYRPFDIKNAVIADPLRGANAARRFVAGARYEVRRWDDDSVVFSGRPARWNAGRLHAQSGDRGWWFNFSPVTEPGAYYIYDVARAVGTNRFEISDNIYVPVLDAALKMFYYNRGNIAHEGNVAGAWTDNAAFVGPGQDTEARYVNAPTAASARDMSGGWFDAGDTNKYVTFAAEPVHQLLTAWQEYPNAFDDEHGIPESGNGVPDVIDEVMVEIEWLKKMQDTDGGVFIKVGTLSFGFTDPPSLDRRRRFYERKCSSSTIAASAMFAHAAVVLRDANLFPDQVTELQQRSLRAWVWYQRNRKSANCDPQRVKAGDADWTLQQQQQQAIVALVYLFALNGDRRLERTIYRNLRTLRPWISNDFTMYQPSQGDALAFYLDIPGRNLNIANVIRARMTQLATTSDMFSFRGVADLYGAFMPDWAYHWGSNSPKANLGMANMTMARLGLGGARNGLLRRRAMAHLHYFHGVNPLSIVYLSNMYGVGADRSVNELFHYWYLDGTDYDNAVGSAIGPAPGYVTGGPNAGYSGRYAPPRNQPAQKAYRDFNLDTGLARTWEISEPAIYYQSAYIRLISAAIGDYRTRFQGQ